MFRPNLKYVASPVPEIIAIGVLGGVANPQSLERGDRNGSERALVSSYRLIHSTIAHFKDIAPPLVCPKFPHVSLGIGEWPLGYEAT